MSDEKKWMEISLNDHGVINIGDKSYLNHEG